MKCPVCDVPLSISSREGVEIDFCPQCRGVWLDRGELDKVIERASAALAPTAAPARSGGGGERERYDDHRDERRYDEQRYDDRDDRDDRRHDERRYGDDHRPPKKKKRSFLEDLFEFD